MCVLHTFIGLLCFSFIIFDDYDQRSTAYKRTFQISNFRIQQDVLFFVCNLEDTQLIVY